MSADVQIWKECIGFEWTEANVLKNWDKHEVSTIECEQVFFNKPLLVLEDEKHSKKEKRYYCLGKTNHVRYLFVVFTIRQKRIRVISARDMHKKERRIYEKENHS